MQKELFPEYNIFWLTVVDSNSWAPHIEIAPVNNVTLDVESIDNDVFLAGFPTAVQGPSKVQYATVEFDFYCDESEKLSKFICSSHEYKPFYHKICMIFTTNNKKYLVHDAVVIASGFKQDSYGKYYISVQARGQEVDII
jgi:hypothetical protein